MSHDQTSQPPGESRGPYLLAPIECRHQQQSRRLMLPAAEVVNPGRAVVLGAGACGEIPLVELTERFAELTLNDIDEASLKPALELPELSVEARGKLKIQIADLTGVTHPTLGEIESALAAAADPPAAIVAMAGALDQALPPEFPIPGQFDLVIVSCVLSQLHFALTHEAARFESRFPGQVEALRQSDVWKAALYKIARRMEDKFIADLAALVAPGGLVYLSESAQMCYIELTPGGQWQTQGTYRMLRTTDLADYVRGRFAIEERGRWQWVVSPPTTMGDTGRLYDVQALVLRSLAS